MKTRKWLKRWGQRKAKIWKVAKKYWLLKSFLDFYSSSNVQYIAASNKSSTHTAIKAYRQLSDEEKSIITKLHSEGKSLRAIGKQIGHHWSTVERVVHRFEAGKSLERLPGTGKSRKLSESERRRIVLMVKRNHNITAREIRTAIGREDVCLNTIMRPIHENGELKS